MNFIKDSEMWHQIKHMFRRLTPTELAARELSCAEISRLEAQSAKEYAEAITAYNTARAKRLREYLQTPTTGKI